MMTEAELQATLIEAAWSLGWMVHHDRPAQRRDGTWTTAIEGHPGFPDLFLVHRRHGKAIAAELKSGDGRITDHQRRWIDRLRAADVPAYVWRPDDLDAALAILQDQRCSRDRRRR